MTKRPRSPLKTPAPPGFAEGQGQAPFDPREDAPEKVVLPPYKPLESPPRVRSKVGPGGRVVIPAAFREATGMKEGEEVLLTLVGKEVRVITLMNSIRQVQDEVMKIVPPGVSLVEELLAERRAEAAAENKDG